MYAMATYLESIRRPPRSLTDREQAALLRVTGERFAGYRDHLLFSMALGTGLRAHELLALNVGDVFDDRADPRRRVLLQVFKGHATHAGAQQDVVFSNTLRLKLQKFHTWKVAQHQSVDATAPLFVSQRRQRLSLRQLRHSFAKWQQRAGFERHLSFHSLRHAACGAVYARSRDLRLTQRFARHRSVVTTMVYTHPSDEELIRAVEQLRC